MTCKAVMPDAGGGDGLFGRASASLKLAGLAGDGLRLVSDKMMPDDSGEGWYGVITAPPASCC